MLTWVLQADHCFQHCESEPTVFENSGQWVLKALYKAEESSPKPERLLTTSPKPVLAEWPKELQAFRSKIAAKHTVPILQKFLNGAPLSLIQLCAKIASHSLTSSHL